MFTSTTFLGAPFVSKHIDPLYQVVVRVSALPAAVQASLSARTPSWRLHLSLHTIPATQDVWLQMWYFLLQGHLSRHAAHAFQPAGIRHASGLTG